MSPKGTRQRPSGLTLEEAFHWYMPGEPPSEGCWEWTGSKTGKYGRFSFQWVDRYAHRVSYELYKGDIPEGMHVLHDPVLCNNTICVNPHHLRIGTDADNNRDQDISGTRSVGQDHPNSKLTEDDVRAIRREYAAGGVSQKELALKYGITQMPVSRIIRRVTWKHVV